MTPTVGSLHRSGLESLSRLGGHAESAMSDDAQTIVGDDDSLARKYRRLIDVGRALSAEKDINSLLERILREAKTMLSADAGSLYLRTPENTLMFAIVLNDTLGIAQGGNNTPVTAPFKEIPIELPDGGLNMTNIATRCAITCKTINISDLATAGDVDAQGAKDFDDSIGYNSKSFLTVPLQNFSQDSIGVLQLLNAKDAAGNIVAFDSGAELLLEALASQAAVALENRYLLDEQEDLKNQLEIEVDERTGQLKTALSKLTEAHIILKELTTIDAVTGIRNRQYFDEVFEKEWKRATRQSYEISMLVLDIDHFKRVNDIHGHLAGDECLARVAKAIDDMLNRPSDVVARFGGEEFVVILPYIGKVNACMLAEQIREKIEDLAFEGDAAGIKVTISIGVATMVPSTGEDPQRLIGNADEALYKAKSTGRNRVCS